MTATVRNFQMTRVQRGWLLPSNDARWLFFVERFTEDGSAWVGVGDGTWKQLKGDFWRVTAFPYDEINDAIKHSDVESWDDLEVEMMNRGCWEYVTEQQDTRREAIAVALAWAESQAG